MARTRNDFTVPLDEGLNRYEDASTKALERITDLGIEPLRDRPKYRGNYFDGRLPSNVNSLSYSELGDIYALMEQWANWLTGYVTVAKAELQNKTEQLKLVKAKVRKSKTGTKDEKEDETISDSRYVEANAAYLEAYEYHQILDGLAEAARRDLRIISRLIEVKKMEFESGRRGSNVQRDPLTNRNRGGGRGRRRRRGDDEDGDE